MTDDYGFELTPDPDPPERWEPGEDENDDWMDEFLPSLPVELPVERDEARPYPVVNLIPAVRVFRQWLREEGDDLVPSWYDDIKAGRLRIGEFTPNELRRALIQAHNEVTWEWERKR